MIRHWTSAARSSFDFKRSGRPAAFSKWGIWIDEQRKAPVASASNPLSLKMGAIKDTAPLLTLRTKRYGL
jgi:hypothetical protein